MAILKGMIANRDGRTEIAGLLTYPIRLPAIVTPPDDAALSPLAGMFNP